MRISRVNWLRGTAWLALAGLALPVGARDLLNASFDISRELFRAVNPAFVEHWASRTGQRIEIRQAHGGSSRQARAVMDGLAADVVTMNQATDVDAIAARGLLPADWRDRLPHQASPFYSAVVFVVRSGNPKNLRDWSDLVRPGVGVVMPNPKTSGNGRYGILSAYVHAQRQPGADEAAAEAFLRALVANVPILDTGGRGATTTFVERGIGDVLLTFEAEALLAVREFGAGRFEVVIPPLSVEAAMPVAVVERVAARRGTAELARAYLEFLYTEPAQELVAQQFFRPRSAAVQARHAARFPALELVRVEDAFGGWEAAQRRFFAEGALFDRIVQTRR